MRNKVTKKNMDLDLRRYGNNLYSKAEQSGGGGSDDGGDSEENKVALSVFKFLFQPNQGKVSGILKLVSDEPWNYYAYGNNGAIKPYPGDTAIFYDFATMTDEDIATIYQDLANGGYQYMLVRSEPIVENYGDLNFYISQEIYYDNGVISLSYNSNICYGIKVDGHNCFWYNYYD